MSVQKIMRQSIKAYAQHVHKNPEYPYSSPNKGPHTKEVERVLSEAADRANQREHAFIEELYSRYGGDPHKLPWNEP